MTADADLSQQLQESERRAALFESIMDSMGESVLLVDRDGKELYGNRELRRFRGEVAPGSDLDAWRAPARMKIFDVEGRELPHDQWPVVSALRGEHRDNFEIRVRGMAHSGDDVVLAISTRALIDSLGRIEGAIVVTRDITSVRQTEEKLRQSQKLETIGQLTGGIAHDFNNLLAAIYSAAEVLKRGVQNDERLSSAAATIEKAAARGADLTRHLLAFARKQPLAPQSVDVDALVREAMQLLRPALGATIETGIVSDPIFALVDPSQLTSALLNLCINARDAMPEGGRLSINVAPLHVSASTDALQAGDYVRLSVADTGTGMSPQVLARAVEPFFTTKGVGKGSGLGLSMAFGLMRQSGGDLRIESEVGRGTTISLILPRTAAPVLAPDAPKQDAPSGKLRVLVVDDDELVRDALCLQLGDEGFDTFTAVDGIAALALVDGGAQFDVLLTDMVMPRGMSGVELAAAIRKRRPNARAIISTGYVDMDLSGAAAEGWSLLRKPYTSNELFAALRAAMLRG